jgi:UDP-2,3-diacylglucosamine pyrophosphatase LpxH
MANKKTATAKTKSEPKEEKQRKPSLRELAVLSERGRKADWNATKEDCILDLRRVQEENPDAFISRNYYRVNGKYSDSSWNAHFGTFQQFKASAGLQLSRAQSHLEKHIARHAHLDIYREFFETEIKPWVGKYEKPEGGERFKTILAASDFHDVEVDEFCLSVFLDTAARVQPDVIVLNGDVFDCYEFSSFSIDPRKYDIKGRFEFVRDRIFKPLRNACPDAQIDLIMGNHEHRILRLLADRSPAFKILADLMGLTFSTLLGLDDWEINLISKSDLAAYNAKETKAEANKNYKVYYNTVVFNHIADDGFGMSTVTGHTHKPKMTTKNTEVMGHIFHVTLGGMCVNDAEYHQEKSNAQNSFGLFHVDTLHRSASPEHFVFGKKHVVVAGQYYTRTA